MEICSSLIEICSIKKVGLCSGWSDFGRTFSDFGPTLSKLYRIKADMLIPSDFAFSSMLSRYSWLTLIDSLAFFIGRTPVGLCSGWSDFGRTFGPTGSDPGFILRSALVGRFTYYIR